MRILKRMELLGRAAQEEKVVSVYSDSENTDSFALGYVEKYSKAHLILRHISPTGFYDGYVLRRMDDIFRIDYDGKYENKITQLYKILKQTHPGLCGEAEDVGSNLITFLLSAAMRQRLVVSIALDSTDSMAEVTGYVNSIGETELTIRLLDEYGEEDGFSEFHPKDIVRINCDTDVEQAIQILNTATL